MGHLKEINKDINKEFITCISNSNNHRLSNIINLNVLRKSDQNPYRQKYIKTCIYFRLNLLKIKRMEVKIIKLIII